MIRVEVVNGLASSRQALADFLQRAEDIASVNFVEVDPASPRLAETVRPGPDQAVIRLVEANLAAADDAGIAGVVRALSLPRGVAGGLIVCARKATGRDVGNLFSTGARGFLFVDSPGEEVITAVRAVADGYRFIPSALMADLTGLPLDMPHRQDLPQVALTGRENEVLKMMSFGHSNEEIAAKLFIAQATVRSHVLSILRKLTARNRTEAVVRAYRKGILSIQAEEEPEVTAR